LAIFDFLRGGSSKDRFAARIIKRLRAAGRSGDIEYDRVRFVLMLFSPAQIINLTNFHNEWNAATGSDRDIVIDGAIAMAMDSRAEESFEEIAANLLPVMRNRTEIAAMGLEPGMEKAGEDYGRAFGVMADNLAIMVVINRPNSLAYVGGDRLETWGRSLGEVHRLAVANLDAIPGRLEKREVGFFVSITNDDFDASRLLIDYIWEDFPASGAPVAIPISRNCVVVAGENDRVALAAMAEFANIEAKKASRLISVAPIIWRDRDWQPYLAQGDDLYGLQFLRVQQRMWDYENQRIHLMGWLERQGLDTSVGVLEAYIDGADLLTRTTWSQAGPALVPETDVVVLENGKSVMVRQWKDVEAVHGPFERLETYPPLINAEQPLTSQAWERLRSGFSRPKGFPLQDAE
jgi:hypothetical protein